MIQKYISGLIIIVILLSGCSSDKPKEMDMRVVGKAGNIEITMSDLDYFMIRMNYMGPEDEFSKKTGFLENYMDKIVTANAGLELGYLDSVEVDTGQDSRILYEVIYKENITDKLDLSRKSFEKFKNKYQGQLHLAQILLNDEKLADSLYQILKDDPDKFEDYVAQFSIDNDTRENKGDLGWRRVIQIPLELREPVFKIKPNSISKPLSSPFGFHLIKLYEKKNDTEQELKDFEGSYYKTFMAHQREKLQKQFLEKGTKTVSLEIYWDSLQVIIDKALKLREEKFGKDQPLSFCISPAYLTDEEKTMIIAHVDQFQYDALLFLEELKRAHVRDGINFDNKPLAEQALTSLLLPRVMRYYGEKTGVRKTPQYKRQYYQTQLGFVYQKFTSEQLLDTIYVSPEELEKTYDHTIHNYLVPEEIRCSEIHLETEEEAEDVLSRLKSGESFEMLVKNTVRPGFAETNGYLGPCSVRRFAPVYNAAQGKRVGEYVGPVEFDGKWSVVRIDEITPERYKPLREVESKVRGFVLGKKKYQVYHNWIDARKEQIEFFIDEELIRNNLQTGTLENAS